ncbi:transporter [Roseovarius faecimaris]|uniref:Transporter n=1 Tax=Roseovarius faecimaris TaxID=2494550 RepID=A0A6I6IP51_9RHOB|nr:fused MFS/spermidine synthase [Roseovarius faecimaris]QGX98052.1 transporter [Roseovarius faecimaris]
MHISDTPKTARSVVPILFVATIFLSASLLFFVQPMFARIVLPTIGGSPAVWTTAMLFFQTVLIAGYLYAHLLTRHVAPRAQLIIHLGVWASALLFLPLAIPEGWRFDPTGPMAWQTLLLFAAGVGLPFFALSANAPLIQFWYGRSGGPSADDPYFLYGASNLGSLVALLGFPLVAEPLFGVSAITFGWAIGFVALGAFLLASGVMARGPALRTFAFAKPARLQPRQLILWAYLAFIPSSLMLSVTSKISLDIGAVPLVWVIPLSLYLLTFVLTFTHRQIMPERLFKPLTALVLVGLLLIFAGLTGPLMSWAKVAFLIGGFFVVALYAHRTLYLARPDASQLTAFYLTMSVGGALGGLFNSIIAPTLFAGLYEAGATVLMAGLMLVPLARVRASTLLRGAGFGLAAALPAYALTQLIPGTDPTALTLVLVAGGFVALLLTRAQPAGAYVAMASVFAASAFVLPDTALLRDRSFFGTHLVSETQGLRLYGNGTTIHGGQRIADDTAARPEPLYYYHPNGPMAQVMTSARGRDAQRIGVVGLGVGSLACYAQPGQDWQFYEIDPMVEAIARDARYFRFMEACAGDAPVHLGDARIVLAAQEPQAYDILVIDAYSSDSVPVHLTTDEAIRLYMRHLAPDGILVFHISNRYYAIDRPLGRSADAQGLIGRKQHYAGNVAQDPADWASIAATLTRSEAALGDLGTDPRWTPLQNDGAPVWTDDHADLLSILK